MPKPAGELFSDLVEHKSQGEGKSKKEEWKERGT